MNDLRASLFKIANEKRPSPQLIRKILSESYEDNIIETIKMLLYIRDKNNGAGKRDFTRICLLWIKNNDEDTFNKIIKDFLYIGRWDDIFFSEKIINDTVFNIIDTHLKAGNTLLKKWLPRESSNTSLARFLASGLGLTMKEYRLSIKKGNDPFVNTLYRPINSYSVSI